MTVQRLMHTNIVCESLETSLAFYADLLGGTVHQRLDEQHDLRPALGATDSAVTGYRAALVYFGDARGGPYLDLLQWHGLRDPDYTTRNRGLGRGLARIALEVQELAALVDRCRAEGHELLGPMTTEQCGPWRMRLAFLTDPDGVLVELAEFD